MSKMTIEEIEREILKAFEWEEKAWKEGLRSEEEPLEIFKMFVVLLFKESKEE